MSVLADDAGFHGHHHGESSQVGPSGCHDISQREREPDGDGNGERVLWGEADAFRRILGQRQEPCKLGQRLYRGIAPGHRSELQEAHRGEQHEGCRPDARRLGVELAQQEADGCCKPDRETDGFDRIRVREGHESREAGPELDLRKRGFAFASDPPPPRMVGEWSHDAE